MRILAREASVWQDGAFWRRYCALYEPLLLTWNPDTNRV